MSIFSILPHIVYAREVRGGELTFGVSGKLIMNALVLYDRETLSLWSQFLGQSVQGKLAGAKLELLPSQLLTWGAWKGQHPDTVALDQGVSTYDPYMPYYFNADIGVYGETNSDSRMRSKSLVVGIVGDAGQKAYAYGGLVRSPIVNDTFDGRGLVVAADPESGAANVFDRGLDGKSLTFEPTERSLFMTDRETGSTWAKETGIAVSGPLKGKRLKRVPSMSSFWFAWSDYYPQTELYLP